MTIVPKQNVDIFAAPEEQFRRRDATFPTQLKWHDYTGGHRGLPETGGAKDGGERACDVEPN